jgi:hypothetical protein
LRTQRRRTHPVWIADPELSGRQPTGSGWARPVVGTVFGGCWVAAVSLHELFTACARVQTRRGSTVVAIIPPPEGSDCAACAPQVIPAARSAGLGSVEHIIAVTAPIAGERITNLAAPASRPVRRAARAATGHGRYHLNLLVVVLKGSNCG